MKEVFAPQRCSSEDFKQRCTTARPAAAIQALWC